MERSDGEDEVDEPGTVVKHCQGASCVAFAQGDRFVTSVTSSSARARFVAFAAIIQETDL